MYKMKCEKKDYNEILRFDDKEIPFICPKCGTKYNRWRNPHNGDLSITMMDNNEFIVSKI